MNRSLALLFILQFSALHLLAQPSVSSFTPLSGPIGTTVTITGANFSPISASNTVYFGAVKATVTAATASSLTVTVPPGATFQPITVTTNNLTAYSSRPFTVTFTGSSGAFTAGSYGFGATVDSVDSGIETTNYTIADLDNDGRVDVITIDRLHNTMTVYRNTTASGVLFFAAGVDFTTGSEPRNLDAGDLDGDGKLDLVVSNLKGNTVSVFRNTTTGNTVSFAAKADFATATQPSAIAITEIDGDGRPDLVVNTLNMEGFVSVLRNTTTGGAVSFASKTDLQSVGGSIENIAVADLDGDGKRDILVPNYALSSISIFKNTSVAGALSFASKTDIPTGQYPHQIEVGDLNSDGKPDMAIGYYLVSNNVSIFRNTSSGAISFAGKVDYTTASSADAIVINDLDGDSQPDMAVCNGTDSIALFKNNSTAGGTIAFYPPVNTRGNWFGPLRAVDMDGDGRPDLLFKSGIFRVTVWTNRMLAPFISSFSPTTGGKGTAVTITGKDFTGATAVSFGGVPASSFTVVNANTITAVVDSGASGNVVVTTPRGTGTRQGFVYQGKPVISSFTPLSAAQGDTVRIYGSNFTGATAVSFGGTPAQSFTVVLPTQVNAIIGPGTSGSVSVTTPYGTSSVQGFSFIPPPLITAITPGSAGAGTTVTITGANFNGATAVRFGGTPASSFNIVSPNTITAVVGNGSAGDVTITTPGGTATFGGFTYLGPSIISLSPAAGGPGATITITGTNFNGTTSVSFGGTPASSFTVVSPTTLRAVVGTGSSGDVIVTTPYGTASYSRFIHTTTPVITSFSPASGPIGTTVTIRGANFYAGTAGVIVYFGAVKASVLSADSATITVKVPLGATYEPVTVNSKGLIACSAQPFITTFEGGSITASSFAAKVNYNVTGNNVSRIRVKDLDGDGRSDLVIANAKNDGTFKAVSIFRNTSTSGSISFASKVDLPMPGTPGSLDVNDIDGDGKMDLLVTALDSSIYVFRNNSTAGSLSFAAGKELPAGKWPTEIAAGDLDGDGKLDVVVSYDDYPGRFSIYRNTSVAGTISFEARKDYTSPFDRSHGISIGDLDGDSKPELVITNYNTAGTFTVYKNTSAVGTISFAAGAHFQASNNTPYAVISDLNRDGKPDIAVVNNNLGGTVSIFQNKSAGGTVTFGPRTEFPASYGPYWLSVGDIDGDGKPDLAFANGGTTGGATAIISVLKNATTGESISFTPPVNYSATYLFPSSLTIGDLDNDGKPDLAVTDMLSNIVSVLRNQSGASVSTACSNGNTTFSSNITGSNYQWQVNTGSGFTPISNSVNYAGATTAALQISNAPTAWNGYQYRCLVDGSYGWTFVLNVDDVSTPAISGTGLTLSITNPDAGTTYTWQVQGSSVWYDVSPLSTGSTFTATSSGSYRVKASKGACATYSTALEVVMTALGTVPATTAGIRIYPNPNQGSFTLDSLNLSDKWETMEIRSASGKKIMSSSISRYRQAIDVTVSKLPSGVYMIVLRNRNGKTAVLKFVKL